jgi:hypothetical protein
MDMYTLLQCIDYFKNFYNEYDFKTIKYAHFLPNVLQICNKMILKCCIDNSYETKI